MPASVKKTKNKWTYTNAAVDEAPPKASRL